MIELSADDFRGHYVVWDSSQWLVAIETSVIVSQWDPVDPSSAVQHRRLRHVV